VRSLYPLLMSLHFLGIASLSRHCSFHPPFSFCSTAPILSIRFFFLSLRSSFLPSFLLSFLPFFLLACPYTFLPPLFLSSTLSRYSSPLDLKGLVLDLRGNPGGLLDAAVEIASYLVPSKSDIVSAKSRNGEEVIYRSVIDPIRPPGMKLAVMVRRCVCSCL
jgi:Peptidase family S41